MAPLTALLLILCLLQPCGAWAQNSDGAREISGRAWQEVLVGIGQDVERRAARVEDVRQALPKLTADIQAALSEADNRLTQLFILRGVSGQTPWTLRTLRGQYVGLDAYLHLKAQNLVQARNHLEKIKSENATLHSIRHKSNDVAYDDVTVDTLTGPARRLESLKAEVEGLKAAIDANLDLVDKFKQQVAQAAEVLKGDYIRHFRGYFFMRTTPAVNTFGLNQLLSSTSDWFGDIQRFLPPVFSWTPWPTLGWVGMSVFLALCGAGFFAARRRGVPLGMRLGAGWLLLNFGVVFYLTSLGIPFAASHPLDLLLVAVACAGVVVILESSFSKGRLWLFFQVFALGILAEAVSLPVEPLCASWPLVMGWGAWRLRRLGAPWQAGMFLSMAFLALFGFGPLVMVFVQAWFLLLLTLGILRSLRELMAQAGSAWLRFVHPLSVALLAVGYLAWVMIFIGGPSLMEHVFSLELDLGKVKLSLDALATMIVLFFLVRLILTWLAAFMDKASLGGKPFDPALGHTLAAGCSYLIWSGYVLVALHMLGVSLSALTWIASGLSVGVGFGLKDIINNFVSGLIILFGGAIKKGDVIQSGKLMGEVVTVSVRNTTVRTMDNSMLIIPNSSFLKGEIINWSYQDKRIRLTIPVSVIPGTKLKKVRKLLLGVAKEHSLVLKDPAPTVLLRQFGKLGLEFELYVWIEDFRDKFKVESDMATTIDQVLQENRVTLAFQSAKVKYKPKGSEDAQAQEAREALRQKRHQVLGLVRPLRRVHQRARWGVPAMVSRPEER